MNPCPSWRISANAVHWCHLFSFASLFFMPFHSVPCAEYASHQYKCYAHVKFMTICNGIGFTKVEKWSINVRWFLLPFKRWYGVCVHVYVLKYHRQYMNVCVCVSLCACKAERDGCKCKKQRKARIASISMLFCSFSSLYKNFWWSMMPVLRTLILWKLPFCFVLHICR